MAGRGLAPTNWKHYSFFLVVAKEELVHLKSIVAFFTVHKQLEEEKVTELWYFPAHNPGRKTELPFLAFSKFVQHAESVTFRELISAADTLIVIKEEVEKLPQTEEVRKQSFLKVTAI
jgi:hypothetical protein